jgi:hypothetical protein
MGTRADFYVGRGPDAEWLGSIAWDGYPDGIDHYVLEGITEDDYRRAVERFLSERRSPTPTRSRTGDATLPEQGWPWPWNDSGTTDFAYAYDSGIVWASNYGSPWFRPIGDWQADLERRDAPSSRAALFPDMSGRKNRAPLGSKRSGTIAITGGEGS